MTLGRVTTLENRLGSFAETVHGAARAAGRALIDACLFVLFLFALLLAAVWRWA